jgi:hypothetical protein
LKRAAGLHSPAGIDFSACGLASLERDGCAMRCQNPRELPFQSLARPGHKDGFFTGVE